jgi:hypothetical protein
MQVLTNQEINLVFGGNDNRSLGLIVCDRFRHRGLRLVCELVRDAIVLEGAAEVGSEMGKSRPSSYDHTNDMNDRLARHGLPPSGRNGNF